MLDIGRNNSIRIVDPNWQMPFQSLVLSLSTVRVHHVNKVPAQKAVLKDARFIQWRGLIKCFFYSGQVEFSICIQMRKALTMLQPPSATG